MPDQETHPCIVIVDTATSRPLGLVRARRRDFEGITTDAALRAWVASPHANGETPRALVPAELTDEMRQMPGTIPVVLVTE